jgi:hypothetical protein
MVMMKTKLVCLLILALHLNPFAQVVPKGTQLKSVYVNGRWGYADPSGRVVIAAQFDAALPFANGIARVGVVDEELPEISASPNIKWGYIDERGRVLVELRYAVLRDFSEGLAAAAVLDAGTPERSVVNRGDRRNLKWDGRVRHQTAVHARGQISERARTRLRRSHHLCRKVPLLRPTFRRQARLG